MSEELSDLTVKQLKALCEEKGLETDGKKADLIARLEAPVEEAPAPVEEAAPEAEEPAPAPEPAPEPKKAKKAKKGAEPDPEDESLTTLEFIDAAYLSLVGREPDAGGRRHYKNAIDLHKTIKRQKLLDDLKASAEYRNQ